MQHIGINLLNEEGEILESSVINFANILKNVAEYNDDGFANKYPLISTIDPYGDTNFNTLQIPLLVKELTVLSDDQENLTKDLISFLNKISTGQTIQFVGD